MPYTDHFRQVTKKRLLILVGAGSGAGALLDLILFFLNIPRVMPYVAIGISIILLIAALDWLDFNFEVLGNEDDDGEQD